MIGYLEGRVLKSSPELLLIDVGGVGYEVLIPLSTYYEIERAGTDEPIGLHVRTHVRDDAITLYGFWTAREKLLFDQLIGVSGIGPKLARVVLSGMSPDELLAALAASDLAQLSRTPGVGKKTAERMIVELRDKVQELAAELEVEPTPSTDMDLVEALISLGYKKRDAEKAAAAAQKEKEGEEATFPELLRLSLSKLSRA